MDAEDLLGRMTLEEKTGQLFFLAFARDRIDEAGVLFERSFVGGSYLSNDNLPDPGAAAALTRGVQAMAGRTRLGIPLLLGADQEGAWSVMYPGSSPGPGNMALGATGRTEDAWEMYRVIGRELAAVGVNTLLAPCADCNTNPRNPSIGVRSFGERPGRVGELVEAAVSGALEGGVLPTVKHFPGHGDTRTDSHRGLPTVDRGREELSRIDLHPFARGIAAGVPIVMTAHILFPALDPERPATMSPVILGEVLRGELGFDGVILSDSMNMLSIGLSFDPRDAVVRAIAAGVDLVMLAEEGYQHDAATYLRDQLALIEAVLAAVRERRLAESRIDDAVLRVLRLKSRLPAEPDLRPGIVGSAEHRAVELSVARSALATLRVEHPLLPVPGDRALVLVNTTPRAAYRVLTESRGIGPNQADAAFDLFAGAVARERPDAVVVAAEEVLALSSLPAALPHDATIVAVTESHLVPGVDFDRPETREVLRAIHAAAPRRTQVIALRDPYELADLPFVADYACAFSARPCAAVAAAELVLGHVGATGISPVSVPGTGIDAA
jgi:beta-N-acetylhexosaminidase